MVGRKVLSRELTHRSIDHEFPLQITSNQKRKQRTRNPRRYSKSWDGLPRTARIPLADEDRQWRPLNSRLRIAKIWHTKSAKLRTRKHALVFSKIWNSPKRRKETKNKHQCSAFCNDSFFSFNSWCTYGSGSHTKEKEKIYGVYLPLLFRVRIRTRVIGYPFVDGFQYCYTQRLTMIRFMQK